MTSFRFSEASRLYSRYAAVVDQVRSAWAADVLAFFAAVQVEIKKTVLPLKFGVDGETLAKTYRYWWLGDGDMRGHVGLWMDNWHGPMIDDRRLILRGGGDKPSNEQLSALRRLVALDDMGGICVPANKGAWHVFTATIPIDEKDPVGSVAPVVARLLMRMHEAAPPVDHGDDREERT